MGAEPMGWLARVSEETRRHVARLEGENQELRARVASLQEEQRRLGDEYAGVQEELNALAVLYAAADRLHATLDVGEIVRVIEDVVANLVGCEEIALYGRADGLDPDRLEPCLPAAIPWGGAPPPPPLRDTARTGIAWFAAPAGERLPSSRAVSAVLPLKVGPRVTGLLALGRLLPQKAETLSALDHELLDLLVLHAGPALHCALLPCREPAGIGS